MCDLAMAERVLELQRRIEALELQLACEDPFPHVHEGYLTQEHVKGHVDRCLEEAAIAAEAELPPPEPPKPKPPREASPAPTPPVPRPAPSPTSKEPGPAGQGAPDRRHALHHKIGGITVGRRA